MDFERLAGDLAPGDGVVIYPEGTRFSPDRLARVQTLLRARDPDRLDRLGPVQHVLPPRPAGTLALLAACPEADVLIVRHTGLEPARTLERLWSGGLIGAHVRVDLRWVAARDVPRDPEAALRWLDAEWAALDAWVERTHRPRSAPAWMRHEDPRPHGTALTPCGFKSISRGPPQQQSVPRDLRAAHRARRSGVPRASVPDGTQARNHARETAPSTFPSHGDRPIPSLPRDEGVREAG